VRPITDEGARALAAAVALRACLDWQLVQDTIQGIREPGPEPGLNLAQPETERRSLECFFLGGWFEALTDQQGEPALDVLRRGRVGGRKHRPWSGRKGMAKRPGNWNISRSWRDLPDEDLREQLIEAQVFQQDVAEAMGLSYYTLRTRIRKGLTDEDVETIREIIRSKMRNA
jgi:hypothetical protein